MKNLVHGLILAALLAPAVASAGADRRACFDAPMSAGAVIPVVDGLAMSSSRSFTYNLDNGNGGYDIASMFVTLVDANSSITTFTTTCTVSRDGNTTDATPQVCDDTSDGTCVQTAGNIFTKATPGSQTWPIRLDVAGYPDIECTFSVGAGSGGAGDLLTVYLRLCVG